MALSWAPHHLADHAASLSSASIRSNANANFRHDKNPVQRLGALYARKTSGRPGKFQELTIRTERNGTGGLYGKTLGVNGRIFGGAEGLVPQVSCSIPSEVKLQDRNPEALHSGVPACSSSKNDAASPPQGPKFLQRLAKVALLALPILFVLSLSSPAIALEPTNSETLNSIVVPPQGGHMSLGRRIAVALRSLGLPDWGTIILVAALPVVELRGAIPVGYWLGLKPLHVFGLAVLGNMLPIPLVIAYIGRVSDWLTERSSLARKFFDWLFKRTRSRADLLVKYRTLGLTLFVAVPLPLTGAWSGAIGAHLLGLPFWESIAANLAGVTIAGAIVTALCQLGWTGAVIAGVGLFAAAIAAFWTSRRKEAVGEDPVV